VASPVRHCFACGAPLPSTPPIRCPACGQDHHLNPKPCGEAVVVHAGRVLLMRRAREPWRGAWEVSGGFCEQAEHPARTAERELQEELGLTGRAVAYLGSWMDTYQPAGGQALEHTLNCAYLIELDDPDTMPRIDPEEVQAADWFDLDALPEPIAFPDHMHAVLRAAAQVDRASVPPLRDGTQ
jgi:ADP-ribose pyrophosphatase YjhB (NUDIX family)